MAIAQTPIRSLVAAMTPEELFTVALGLGQQWRVVECRFEGEPKRLELRLEHVRGQHFGCPQCGTLCGVTQAHAKKDWSAVRQIAVDETSARRGHRYVTNVLGC